MITAQSQPLCRPSPTESIRDPLRKQPIRFCALVTLYCWRRARPSGFGHGRKLRAATLGLAFFIVAAQLGNAVTGGFYTSLNV